SVTVQSRDPMFPISVTLDLSVIQTNQVDFLGNFSGYMGMLRGMAEKELAQQPFSQSEANALQDVVERTLTYTGERRWNGWYPQLFYTNALGGFASQKPGCDQWDPLV